jgi:hypothetical protein
VRGDPASSCLNVVDVACPKLDERSRIIADQSQCLARLNAWEQVIPVQECDGPHPVRGCTVLDGDSPIYCLGEVTWLEYVIEALTALYPLLSLADLPHCSSNPEPGHIWIVADRPQKPGVWHDTVKCD